MTESIFDAIGHNFLVGAPSDSSKDGLDLIFKMKLFLHININLVLLMSDERI